MDSYWKEQYEKSARNDDFQDYKACFWSKTGFEELFRFTEKLLANEVPGTALDVGCGTGAYCTMLKEKGFIVTGVDYSENMIKRAKKNDPDNIYYVMDASDLKFPDESFDLVLCIGILQCVRSHEKVISELKRVAKRKIIISTLRRKNPVNNLEEYKKSKLKTDNWPTFEYHPSEITKHFEGWNIELHTHWNGVPITDGFFVVATR